MAWRGSWQNGLSGSTVKKLRRAMRGERIDVAAVQPAEQILVRHAFVELVFAIPGAHQETARTAGGIEHDGFWLVNAKGVDDIHDVFFSVMLAELVAFFRADQLLKEAAENVRGNLFEVDSLDRVNELAPRLQRIDAGERHQRRFFVGFGKEDRLVIAGAQNGFLKAFAQIIE